MEWDFSLGRKEEAANEIGFELGGEGRGLDCFEIGFGVGL